MAQERARPLRRDAVPDTALRATTAATEALLAARFGAARRGMGRAEATFLRATVLRGAADLRTALLRVGLAFLAVFLAVTFFSVDAAFLVAFLAVVFLAGAFLAGALAVLLQAVIDLEVLPSFDDARVRAREIALSSVCIALSSFMSNCIFEAGVDLRAGAFLAFEGAVRFDLGLLAIPKIPLCLSNLVALWPPEVGIQTRKGE